MEATIISAIRSWTRAFPVSGSEPRAEPVPTLSGARAVSHRSMSREGRRTRRDKIEKALTRRNETIVNILIVKGAGLSNTSLN